jgi:hypothetical protein
VETLPPHEPPAARERPSWRGDDDGRARREADPAGSRAVEMCQVAWGG